MIAALSLSGWTREARRRRRGLQPRTTSGSARRLAGVEAMHRHHRGKAEFGIERRSNSPLAQSRARSSG
jgi:hypothetical protein